MAERCSAASPVPTVTQGRVERRRALTRAALLRAAQQLLSSGDEVTVAQITKQADVALASFYAHFESKDSLLAELTLQTVADLALRFDDLPTDTDPAIALAAAVRHFWAWYVEDSVRGRYVLQAARVTRTLAGTLGAALAALIERGRTTGRFAVSGTAAVTYMLGGALMGATRGHSDGHISEPDLDDQLVRYALRLVGLSDHDVDGVITSTSNVDDIT